MENLNKNRFIWFFRLNDGRNQCEQYNTKDKSEAIKWLRDEYGSQAIDAVQREVTDLEYKGLIAANQAGREKAYEAIQDFFFRCNPRHKLQ